MPSSAFSSLGTLYALRAETCLIPSLVRSAPLGVGPLDTSIRRAKAEEACCKSQVAIHHITGLGLQTMAPANMARQHSPAQIAQQNGNSVNDQLANMKHDHHVKMMIKKIIKFNKFCFEKHAQFADRVVCVVVLLCCFLCLFLPSVDVNFFHSHMVPVLLFSRVCGNL